MVKRLICLFIIFSLVSCLPQLQYANDNQGDNNDNGVRDDIEEYIDKAYSDPNLGKALYQYSHDSLMLNHENLTSDELFKNYELQQRSTYCVWFIAGDFDNRDYKLMKEVSLRQKNSWKNLYSARKAGEALAGKIYFFGIKMTEWILKISLFDNFNYFLADDF